MLLKQAPGQLWPGRHGLRLAVRVTFAFNHMKFDNFSN
ncbi:hypothetical protein BER2_0552 [plant metagenome]|uniref:Uncharacterized protein n=1 Tax=plant metagenome TaxID=1297885 RepID=A0A484V1S8_9ZZZZ